MFHGIKYLIVSLVFSHLSFWSRNLFLIAPFPDLCLLVPFHCTDTVESEEHVLLDYPLYHQIREPWFAKLREHVPDFYTKTRQDKLICIFSCEIIPVIRLNAKICNDILSERRKQLYK